MAQSQTSHPVVVCWRGPESAAATGLGSALAKLVGQQLILATAYDYEPSSLTADVSAAERSEALRELAEAALLEAQRAADPALQTRLEVLAAMDVPTALADLAKEVDAAVLVFGRDRDRHHVVPAVGKRLACPLAVAPIGAPTDPPPQLLRIGVAFDDTEASRDALRIGRQLASAAGGQVTMVCVDGEPGPWPASEAAGADLGVDAEPLLLQGDVVSSLRSAAKGLDLLICGSHGRGLIKTALLGSVSAKLIEDCPSPLLVVPPGVGSGGGSLLGITAAAD
ncbi:MAG: universal stress protein [Solirubrobacteraceae bacterium]|nr:universal stress protein [Solirubrobacteraceae bacterium]